MKISEYFYTYQIYGEKFIRIDWIYSKSFDRVFIGIVKKNEKLSYINTFIYDINSVDKLVMQKKSYLYAFIIIFKDQNSEEICEFERENKYGFDHLLYLFNGKLEDIKGDNNIANDL